MRNTIIILMAALITLFAVGCSSPVMGTYIVDVVLEKSPIADVMDGSIDLDYKVYYSDSTVEYYTETFNLDHGLNTITKTVDGIVSNSVEVSYFNWIGTWLDSRNDGFRINADGTFNPINSGHDPMDIAFLWEYAGNNVKLYGLTFDVYNGTLVANFDDYTAIRDTTQIIYTRQ